MSVNVGTAVGYLDLDTSKFKNALKDAQSQLSSFSDKTLSAGEKFTNFGSGLKAIGSTLSKSVTVPLLGIGTASIATAATFEKSMDNVAALSGATGKDLEDLTNLAKKMGETTQFSASEAADALGYMALAGWKTDESMKGLPGVLDLAAASGMGLAEASDMVTDYLSAFGEEADQAGRMADVLAKAQASSNTTAQGLGEAFKNCAVNANAFGLDIEQTTAVLGKLADQGLKGSEAGTALNAVFRDMSSKMKNGAIQIGKTSVKITDAQGNFRSLADIVTDVEKATDGLSESEKMVALQSTFTADSIKAMGILMNTGGDSINDFTNELYGAEGAASKMASAMNDNLSGQLTLLKSALESAAMSIGEALMPAIKGLVEWLNDLVTWFNNLSPGIQTAIVVFGAVLAAIGPVILIVGQLCTAIGALVGFFSAGGLGATVLGGAIALLSGPVGIAIGIISSLIAVGVLLYKNWDEIKAKASEIWNGIKDTIMNAMNWLGEQLGFNTEEIFAVITDTWNSIKDTLGATLDVISKTVSDAWESIKEVIDMTVGVIFTTVKKAWDDIKDALSMVGDAIQQLIDGDWEGAKETIRQMNEKIKEIVSMAWNKIKATLSQAGEAIKNIAEQSWNKIKVTLSQAMENIKTAISNGWENIKNSTKTACDNVKKIAKTIFDGIKNDISNALSNAFNTAKSWWDKITNIFKNPIKAVVNLVQNGAQALLANNFIESQESLKENDYSRARFNYARVKQTAVSDVMAINESISSAIGKVLNDIKLNKKVSGNSTNSDYNNEKNYLPETLTFNLQIGDNTIANATVNAFDHLNGKRVHLAERGLVL